VTEVAAPRRSWLTWALVASLGLNLAFLGLIAGAFLHGPPRMMAGPALWHYARALPEPYRRDLGRELRASRGDWSGPRDALRAQRAALAEALTADPFDPAAVTAVLVREGRLTDELAERGTRMLVSQIARMMPEERAAYAATILEDRHRHGRRR
jgi:uncharacterized membrane protein